MREIKFRAWVKQWNKMEYGVGIMNGVVFRKDGAIIGKKSELMQYTGLKDKNGKEIYEGDILNNQENKIIPWPRIVEWDSEIFHGFVLRDNALGNKTKFPVHMSEVNWFSQCEVIGNIYENPELIKS